MPSEIVEIHHEAQLGQMAPAWREWCFIVGPRPWKVYMELRRTCYDGTRVDLRLLARILRMSKTALLSALETLCSNGLITIDED